jgi:hypothetical protein
MDPSQAGIAGSQAQTLQQIEPPPQDLASASQHRRARRTPPASAAGAQAANAAGTGLDDDAGVEVTSASREMLDAGAVVEDARPARPVASASPACRGRTGYVSPSDGRCYFTVTERMTWHTARDECMRIGAHLATLTNDREQAFVASFEATSEAWLGLSRFGALRFSWITNEELAFMHWEEGAPRERQESGAVILPDTGLWSDRPPMDRYAALCETEPPR